MNFTTTYSITDNNISIDSLALIREGFLKLFKDNEDCPVINDYIQLMFPMLMNVLSINNISLVFTLDNINTKEENKEQKYIYLMLLNNIKSIEEKNIELKNTLIKSNKEYNSLIIDLFDNIKDTLNKSNLTKECIDFWENVFKYPDKNHLLVFKDLIKKLSNEPCISENSC